MSIHLHPEHEARGTIRVVELDQAAVTELGIFLSDLALMEIKNYPRPLGRVRFMIEVEPGETEVGTLKVDAGHGWTPGLAEVKIHDEPLYSKPAAGGAMEAMIRDLVWKMGTSQQVQEYDDELSRIKQEES